MSYDPSIHEIRKAPGAMEMTDAELAESQIRKSLRKLRLNNEFGLLGTTKDNHELIQNVIWGKMPEDYKNQLLHTNTHERDKWLRGEWKELPPEAVAELRQEVTDHGKAMVRKMLLSGKYGKFGDTDEIN